MIKRIFAYLSEWKEPNGGFMWLDLITLLICLGAIATAVVMIVKDSLPP